MRSLIRYCAYCDKSLTDKDAFWVAAGPTPNGEYWHKACWERETSPAGQLPSWQDEPNI